MMIILGSCVNMIACMNDLTMLEQVRFQDIYLGARGGGGGKSDCHLPVGAPWVSQAQDRKNDLFENSRKQPFSSLMHNI